MTDPRVPDRPEEPSDVSTMGEYVLGLLSPEEAAEIEARLPREPALAALHSDWADAVSTLAGGRDVAPPAGLRARIEARLFVARTRRRRGAFGWLAWIAGPALVLAAAFFFLNPATTFRPDLQATIVAPDATLRLTAQAGGDELRVTRLDGGPLPGRVLELWLIAGDAAPVSLGVLPAEGEARFNVPASFTAGAVLAVSDEPPGGSTTGAPTGAVLATGEITSL